MSDIFIKCVCACAGAAQLMVSCTLKQYDARQSELTLFD